MKTRQAFSSLCLVLIIPLLGMLATCRRESSVQKGPDKSGMVRTVGTRFVDATGEELILRGLNLVNKSRKEGYLGGVDARTMTQIRNWGMNCIRLGVFWDAVEPSPGVIDQEYLGRVARVVGWAKAEGIYVLLDMHQDLYSVKFHDGAPLWATLDGGKAHQAGEVWDDAYYSSEAVQAALDNFWRNAPAPDGKGLQEHYAAGWRAVARKFSGEPAVLGYDLMNEPFPGKDAARAQAAGLEALSGLLKEKKLHPASTEELLQMFADPPGRRRLMTWLKDLDLYERMLQGAAPILQEFERSRVQPFYQRVAAAIRLEDRDHLLFLETSMGSNMGIPTALEPLKEDQGQRDPAQAFAPHAYDIVVDTAHLDLMSQDRLALILKRHKQTAERLQMPMLVGEWGAYYLNPNALETARFTVNLLDQLACSDAYWSYSPELASSPLLSVLRRERILRIN